MADTTKQRLEGKKSESELPREQQGLLAECSWWSVEPRLGRVAHGVAYRVDRLKAIGNGQVSEVVRTAWKILSDQPEDAQ